jgi:hypothetical protein
MPNPPEVDVIWRITSYPQSEHVVFNSMVDLPGLDSKNFLNMLIMDDNLPPVVDPFCLKND